VTSIFALDAKGRQRIERLLRFASKPENHYRPGPGVPPPGDDSRYCVKLGTYRSVFTHTRAKGKIFRHLSISVQRDNRYPLVEVAEVIGRLFGFEGPFESWGKTIHKDTQSVVMIQEIVQKPN
jgi:hypothetical protein